MDKICQNCDTPYNDFIEIVTDQENDSIMWKCPGCGLRITDSEFQSA